MENEVKGIKEKMEEAQTYKGAMTLEEFKALVIELNSQKPTFYRFVDTLKDVDYRIAEQIDACFKERVENMSRSSNG